jgi:L-lactate dehydrogenase complex protein LldG
MTSREEVFRRIRAAKGTSTIEGAAGAYATIERDYIQQGVMEREDVIDLLEERLRDYDAGVYRVTANDIGLIASRVLQERRITRVLVPEGLPQEWMQGSEFVTDDDFDAQTLNSFDGVMTSATLAIAETGTVILQNVPGQGRRAATLVPDYHLCIVQAGDVVETVVEGMRLLEKTKELPTTFFSGPSATADIEMTRIKGVHGPRFVDVFLVVG